MFIAVGITLVYIVVVWFVFFKARLLKFSIVWGVVSFWVGAHLLLIFLVTLRFYQPMSLDAHTVRPVIQIVPRLSEPTLLVDAVVEPNTLVKKGDILYRFDDSIYRQKVFAARAQLVAAEQNEKILEQDLEIASDQVEAAEARLQYSESQQERYQNLVPQGGARQDELDRWDAQVFEDGATLHEAEDNLAKAQTGVGLRDRRIEHRRRAGKNATGRS